MELTRGALWLARGIGERELWLNLSWSAVGAVESGGTVYLAGVSFVSRQMVSDNDCPDESLSLVFVFF